MAIQILRPRQGIISVQPTQSYDAIVAKYQDEFRRAILAEENANVTNKLRALGRGDLSYKNFAKYIKEMLGHYDEGSQRRADLREVLDKAQIADLRRRDLSLQNKLTERVLSGGLTASELLGIARQRMDFLRNEKANIIDPELYSSAMNEFARVQQSATARGRAQLGNDLRRQFTDAWLRFSDPNRPDHITAPQLFSEARRIFGELEGSGIITPEEMKTRAELAGLERLLADGQLVSVIRRDATTLQETATLIPSAYLTNRFTIDEVPGQFGVNVWRATDVFTGKTKDFVGGDFGKQQAEEYARAEGKATSISIEDPSGKRVELFYDFDTGKHSTKEGEEYDISKGIPVQAPTPSAISQPTEGMPIEQGAVQAARAFPAESELAAGVKIPALSEQAPLFQYGTPAQFTEPAVATPLTPAETFGNLPSGGLQQIGRGQGLQISPTGQLAGFEQTPRRGGLFQNIGNFFKSILGLNR